jgi:hypothetical protein
METKNMNMRPAPKKNDSNGLIGGALGAAIGTALGATFGIGGAYAYNRLTEDEPGIDPNIDLEGIDTDAEVEVANPEHTHHVHHVHHVSDVYVVNPPDEPTGPIEDDPIEHQPEIRVISYERVTAEDGSQMDVARITIDGQEAAIVDVDLDGWADGMVADYNQDGNISEDEIVSFQGGDRIEMAPLAQAVNYEGDTGGFVDGGEPIDIIDVDGGDEFDGGDDDGEPIDNVEPDWNDDDILPAIDDEDLLTASNTDDGAMPDYVNNGDVSDMGSDDMLLV